MKIEITLPLLKLNGTLQSESGLEPHEQTTLVFRRDTDKPGGRDEVEIEATGQHLCMVVSMTDIFSVWGKLALP
jgi:hypothetical protein